MLCKLLFAGFFATALAVDVGNFTAWAPNKDAGIGGGAEVTFTIDEADIGSITNGTGYCDIDIATDQVEFAHFYFAHVAQSSTAGSYRIYLMNEGEGASQSFIFTANAEPIASDISIVCTGDDAMPSGSVVLSSFPRTPHETKTRGSFTAKDFAWPAEVVLSFDANTGPANITLDDPYLTLSGSGDSWIISNVAEKVNYNDVWFELDFGDNPATPAASITLG